MGKEDGCGYYRYGQDQRDCLVDRKTKNDACVVYQGQPHKSFVRPRFAQVQALRDPQLGQLICYHYQEGNDEEGLLRLQATLQAAYLLHSLPGVTCNRGKGLPEEELQVAPCR